MKIDVAEQGRNHPALRRPIFRVAHLPFFPHSGFEPLVNQASYHSISDPPVQELPQPRFLQRVEILANINLDNPLNPLIHALAPNSSQGLMRRTARPKPIREVLKVLLENGLQQHGNRPLHHLVLNGRHTDASSLLTVAFGNVDSLDGRSEITAALDPIEQAAQILIEILPVLAPTLSIDSRGALRFDSF